MLKLALCLVPFERAEGSKFETGVSDSLGIGELHQLPLLPCLVSLEGRDDLELEAGAVVVISCHLANLLGPRLQLEDLPPHHSLSQDSLLNLCLDDFDHGLVLYASHCVQLESHHNFEL